MTNYIETTDETMQSSAEDLAEAVVGRKIISVEETAGTTSLTLTLDDGSRVRLHETADCCAYTALDAFLLHPDKVEHVITGVKTEDNYQTWHILADMGDVLDLTVGWSEGNPYYYSYGFEIEVIPA